MLWRRPAFLTCDPAAPLRRGHPLGLHLYQCYAAIIVHNVLHSSNRVWDHNAPSSPVLAYPLP
jgi:hypothetical protein